MELREMAELVGRLVKDPHDMDAVAQAHQGGQSDPKSYAMLLEKVGTTTADPAFASRWLMEAAKVWRVLNDIPRTTSAVMIAIDRDPSWEEPAEWLSQLYRERGDEKALAALNARRGKALRTVGDDLRAAEALARDAKARAEEIDKARTRAEDERKAMQARIVELEVQRQRQEDDPRTARARAEEIDSVRQREAEERRAAEARAEDLEKGFAARREIRDEIAKLRETAQSLRTALESSQRCPLLDADTQRARRNVVVVSAITGALAVSRLAPTEINIVGIRLQPVPPSSIMVVALAVVLYLLAAFVLKAWDALRVWRKSVNDAYSRLLKLRVDQRIDVLAAEVPDDVALVRAFLDDLPAPRPISASMLSDLVMPVGLALLSVVACLVMH